MCGSPRPRDVVARPVLSHVATARIEVQTTARGVRRRGGGVSRRLDLLGDHVEGGTSVPGAVLVAVVHGELLALSPFGTANGVVARAAARLTTIGTGLDPKGLIVPEVYFLRRSDQYA